MNIRYEHTGQRKREKIQIERDRKFRGTKRERKYRGTERQKIQRDKERENALEREKKNKRARFTRWRRHASRTQ